MKKRSNDPPDVERRKRLGQAIRDHRGRRSQAALGKLVGVPQTTVSRWEAGEVDLGCEQILAIEDALQIRHGVLAEEAGYADPRVPDPDDLLDGFRVDIFDSFSEALAEVKAAKKLGIGVRLVNRWRLVARGADEPDELREDWIVVLNEQPPEA